MNMVKGVFISFEGGEGGGKSTQILRIREKLEKEGKKLVLTREPGGTTISEQIREVVLSQKNMGMAYTTEVLLYQAARAQVYRELILPALEIGKWVLADRTSDSSLVYQGLVRGFGVEKIKELNDLSTKQTYPDTTFLLDVPVDIGLGRRNETGEINRLDMESREFHEKVRQGYISLAKEESQRWVVVDASKSVEEVTEKLWSYIKQKFEL